MTHAKKAGRVIQIAEHLSDGQFFHSVFLFDNTRMQWQPKKGYLVPVPYLLKFMKVAKKKE
jgi:hypothetical protein